MSLTARQLEENGIPTVVLGSGRDIVEHCAVPRFLFVDFPLGNPCGIPYDREMQAAIARQAVEMLESAEGPQTTVRASFDWNGASDWRDVYNRVRPEDPEVLLADGERRRTRMAKRPKRVFSSS